MIKGERGHEEGPRPRGREEGHGYGQGQGQHQEEELQLGSLPPRSRPQIAVHDPPGEVDRERSGSDGVMQERGGGALPASGPANRTIRFPDEAHDGGRTGTVDAVA